MAEIVPPENTTDLPARLRVHALAKLLGVSSKDVLAQLEALGSPAKGAQSGVDRAVAEQVRDALAGAAPATLPVVETDAPTTEAPTTEAPAPVLAVAAAAPLFMAPEPAPAPRRRRASRAAGTPEASATPVEAPSTDTATDRPAGGTPALAPDAPAAEAPTTRPRRRRSSRATAEPAPAADVVADEVPAAQDTAPDGAAGTGPTAEDTDDDGQPKRRRRGRRGRGRGRGPSSDDGSEDSDDEGADDAQSPASTVGEPDTTPDEASSTPDADADEDDSEAGGTRRRRRRRRRSGGGGDGAADGTTQGEDDPPNTVVHEREPRSRGKGRGSGRGDSGRDSGREGSDEVQGITGSTRLEAKRQRRRDGREGGRRRPPILSEAEFLARREAVDRTMVVRQHGEQTQVAVLEDQVLVEHFVTSASSNAMAGNIYLGRVQNVLPSMEAAFVDVGRGRNGVLYAGEVDWDAAGLGGRSRKIEQALHSGDLVLVQVSKDPIGHKGARLTTQISLPGRFLVYVPGGGSTGISRKLPDTERTRLKGILKRIVPADAGVIVRTASEGVSEEDLATDVARLQAQWETISAKAEAARAASAKNPVSLYEEPDLLVKVVRDLFNEDFRSLVVAGDAVFATVDDYVRTVAPDLADKVSRHTGDEDVFTVHRVHEQLAKAMDRKVWLPSGGTLIIERTEAMTVVDVNTGKFTGAGGNLEETVTRNNLEAAEEIVRQMRLRDIGGMIVVDFIDMVLESNRDLVLRRLTECLGRDRTRHQVSEVTSLGLVQMTRKRVGAGLIEEFSVPCEHCHGTGHIVQTEPVAPATDAGARSDQSSRDAGRRGRGGRTGDGATREPERPAKPPVDLSSVVPETPSTPPLPGPRRRGASAPAQTVSPAADAVMTEELLPPAAVPAPGDVPTAPVVTDEVVTDEAVTDEPVAAPPARRSRARRASRPTAAPEAAPEPVVVTAPALDVAAEPVVVTATDAAPTEVDPAAVPEPVAPVRKSRARRASRPVSAPETAAELAAGVEVPVVATPAEPEPTPAAAPVKRARRRAAGRAAGPPQDEIA